MKRAIFVIAVVATLAAAEACLFEESRSGSSSQKECTDCVTDSTLLVDTPKTVIDTVYEGSKDLQLVK